MVCTKVLVQPKYHVTRGSIKKKCVIFVDLQRLKKKPLINIPYKHMKRSDFWIKGCYKSKLNKLLEKTYACKVCGRSL